MSFRLQDQENISDGLRRIAIEQIDKALEQSRRTDKNFQKAAHDLRVCFKKIRATLRLARGGLDADVFRKENRFYRDAGRRLAPLRSPAALAEAYDELLNHFARETARGRLAKLKHSLHLNENHHRVSTPKALREVAGSLHAARRRAEHWRIHCDEFDSVETGLGQAYKDGRAGFARAYENCTVKAFHEWRKSVKYLWYQVRILRPVWPPVMKALAGELEALGDLVSIEHDLALLRIKILHNAKAAPREDIEALLGLIEARRRELRASARELGARIYAGRRRDFLKRVRAYWTGWQEESESRPLA